MTEHKRSPKAPKPTDAPSAAGLTEAPRPDPIAAASPIDATPGGESDSAKSDHFGGRDAHAASGALPFPVVGIGASAGGLAAFETFFSAMPPQDTGMAYVLVQHLAPDHKSVLSELVQRYTRMRVHEAADGMAVQPDCTYIIPPNHDLTLVDGALRLRRHRTERVPHLTVDRFFSSLAQSQRERAICIVMSGTGTDGTMGVREVKGEGGLAIVQAPETTEYDGMPRSAIATGMVDFVLAPADMPARLLAYARMAFDPARHEAHPLLHDGLVKKICLLLRAHSGHDFSQYKETTLLRRLDRRMALHQLEHGQEYLRYARDNPAELDALFRDLLIGVTNFFRDPDAFQVLQTTLIPRLVAGKGTDDTLRVWVCGCSTGEEAYSIAIVLHEHLSESKKSVKLQVFATDIDRDAIERARAGVYPANIAAHVSEQRLSRYFTQDAQRGTYRIQKHIRDLLVFSEQDVIKDPPFSKLDLLSCRNLLIYLNSELQRKLIPLFHYALASGGALFLGSSETVGDHGRLFTAIDRRWKIYVRLPDEPGTARAALPRLMPPLPDAQERRTADQPAHAGGEFNSLRQVTERALLAHYAQAAVLVTARGQVLHIFGRTGQFLEPSAGDATMNVLAMARDGLRRELTIALHKAVAQKELVSYPNLRVKANGDTIRADMSVLPVEMDGVATAYLVMLEVLPEQSPEAAAPAGDADPGGRIDELERELRAKDEYLQTTLEEMETTNEELKSTNEEMQSINEELQSTNEELETSKEELQSVNEELSTVNAELQDKVADLSRVNNDMNNLLAGTGVAMLFVDHQLRITRFTPAATQVIHFIHTDIGRPLEHMASNLVGYDTLVADIREVLDTLVIKEAEVQVKTGTWYLMRIRPYRTVDNRIEGAVITLVDVTERKKLEQAVRRSEARLNVFVNQAYAGVSECDLEGKLLFVNDRLCEMLGYTRDELLRRRLADITDPEDVARVRAQLESLAAGGADLQVKKRYLRADGRRLHTRERVSAIRDADGAPTSLLMVSFDEEANP